MPSTRHDEIGDFAFADKALALRERAGVTQKELAALLSVSDRSIQAWEAGLSYPGAERLKHLISFYLERGALAAGQEEEEAEALWAIVCEKASRRTTPFDRTWFASLRPSAAPEVAPAPPPPPSTPDPVQWHDWGETPAVRAVQGRARELALLSGWVREDRCRVVEILGAGGVGKTTLAGRLARDLAPEFAVVYWRSLRNALPVEEWLGGAIGALSAGKALVPDGFDARLGLLLQLARIHRALLVLDNLEAILEPSAPGVRYQAGYAGYGMVLARMAESEHRSCLLLISREKPLRADNVAIRELHLKGLAVEDGRALLDGRALIGDDTSWHTLVTRYVGNPLALGAVGETIGVVFGGDIASFLAQETSVFGGIRQLLDEQVGRLSVLERTIGRWLAVEREPIGFAELAADLGPGVARGDLVEAVEALERRSLLEWGTGGAFTLQPVVLEYVTTRLVNDLVREILAGEPDTLVSRAILKATAKDYVRRGQERLIAQPVLEQLLTHESMEAVELRLLGLLDIWRRRSAAEQGYGPGNVVNLARLLRGHLRGLDLAHLIIRQAYLQEVEAQDSRLTGVLLSQSVLSEAFEPILSLAVSADGHFLAAGTMGGEVRLWSVADRTPLVSVRGHIGAIYGVALSADGRLLVSGGADGMLRFWEASSGAGLAALKGNSGGVYGVALSSDGTLAVSCGVDGAIRLWSVGSGECLATLLGHQGVVYSVALSADATLLASGGADGTVRLWSVESSSCLEILTGHSGGVRGVALTADGRLLAGGGLDGTVRLWETERGECVAILQEHVRSVWCVSLTPDGSLLAGSGVDGSVRLWDVASRTYIASLQGHGGAVWSTALSGDGRLAASGGVDGTVRLWDTAGKLCMATLHGYTSVIRGVAISADGRRIVSSGVDGAIRLWDVRRGACIMTLQEDPGTVYGVALSADGFLLATSELDGTVRIRELKTGTGVATLRGHTGVAYGVALSGNGAFLASGGLDGTIQVWRWRTGAGVATLHGHTGGVNGVALSTDGTVLASGGVDGTLRLWQMPVGACSAILRGHSGSVYCVALSGDGGLVASGGLDGTVRLWAVDSGQCTAILQEGAGVVRGVALSADGMVLASGGQDGTVRLWDTKTGSALLSVRPDRPYERMDITNLSGVTEAQRAALKALGAVEYTAQATRYIPGVSAHPSLKSLPSAPTPASTSWN